MSAFEDPAKEPVVETTVEPTPPPDLTARALDLRLRQQEILAELGVLALQRTTLEELLQKAAELTAEGLRAEFSKVLEYLPGEKRLLVRAGTGWGPGVVGFATVGADQASPAGFALRTGRPVISNHLENEERFRTPELLLEYGIHRAINVILQGDGTPFGVLEVDSRSAGEFTEHDITFLQGAANLLGFAVERNRVERELKEAVELQELLLQEGNHRVANSLQLVVSLLGVQASAADSAEVRDHLQEAVSRISAIARAHQRLYRTRQIQRLDLGLYLKDVCSDIDDLSAQCDVHTDLVEGIEIATDRAVPIALVVTELITKAAQQYTTETSRPIWVRLARDEGRDAIIISVRDEGGVNKPEFQRKDLGMRIVAAFVAQLHAEIEAEPRAPGVEFILRIPIKPER